MEQQRGTIKQWRYWKGLSQRALAERASVAQNTISRIEKEEMLPSPPTLLKLTTALGIQPWQVELDLTSRRPRGRPRKTQPDQESEDRAA